MSHVRAIPGWSEARDAVRNNEQLNWRVRHLPDNSVGFLNEVKKYFDQAKENAASTFAQNRNQQVSSTHGMAADAIKQVAIAKTTNPANGFSAYDAALGIQAGARERYLDPLLNGPLGKIADQPETKRVINALFDANPLPGSQDEVRLAVTAIAGGAIKWRKHWSGPMPKWCSTKRHKIFRAAQISLRAPSSPRKLRATRNSGLTFGRLLSRCRTGALVGMASSIYLT